MNQNRILMIPTLLLCFCVASISFAWESEKVYYADGVLQYATDAEGNRIPDFSYVGYNYGAALPDVPVVHTIGPIDGDNTAHIQRAIDNMECLPKDGNGFCGTLLLKPGTYSTDNPIYLKHDGVVLRGSGSGNDPAQDTIIQSTRTGTDNFVVQMGSSSRNTIWGEEVPGSKVSITDSIIPIGMASFFVSDAGGYNIGDHVIVQFVPNSSWFTAVDEGGTHDDADWSTLDAFIIPYSRKITDINGNKMTVDVPFYQQLKAAHGNLSLYKYDTSADEGIRYNMGIENLRIDIQTNGGEDEEHTKSALRIISVIDGWAKDVYTTHFKISGIELFKCSRITIDTCYAGNPVGRIIPPWRYNFAGRNGAQEILIKNSTAHEARHGFILNGKTSNSGFVVVDSTLRQNITASEGHRWWSQGILFDNLNLVDHRPGYNKIAFAFYNRGNYGTSHGWAAVNSVIWNTTGLSITRIVVEKPPTGQNYAIGCSGNLTSSGPFQKPAGWIEGTENGATLIPSSLYQAQLADRLPASETSTLNATDDAYVRGDGTEDGIGTKIYIKGTPSTGYDRRGYVKFDASAIHEDVVSATLRLYCTSGTAAITAYEISDDSWSETAITYCNAPAFGSAIATQTLSNSTWIEWNVTAYVTAQVAGNKLISFALYDTAQDLSSNYLNSKEAGSNVPELVITTASMKHDSAEQLIDKE